MLTTKMLISTKKGEAQALRWGVVQDHPWPDITMDGCRAHWRNFGGLFTRFGQPAAGIGNDYYAYLLSPEADVSKGYDRSHYAGYVKYNPQTDEERKPTPGTIVFRGRDLGETSIHFEGQGCNLRPGGLPWCSIRVNYTEVASNSERELFEKQIIPPLWTFITANKAQLKAEAVAAIKNQFAAKLKEMQEQVIALNDLAEQATF